MSGRTATSPFNAHTLTGVLQAGKPFGKGSTLPLQVGLYNAHAGCCFPVPGLRVAQNPPSAVTLGRCLGLQLQLRPHGRCQHGCQAAGWDVWEG